MTASVVNDEWKAESLRGPSYIGWSGWGPG